ncbi:MULTISPECIES: delta-60 repeat domain-containing protein [Chitinophagaceae]
MRRSYISILILFYVLLGLYSCSKEDTHFNPYVSTLQPAVKFLTMDPSPSSGYGGTNATFYVRGLGNDTSKFQFFVNQQRVEVVRVQDSAITVKIPEDAATGAASVIMNGVSYFGPDFTVVGNVSIDNAFNVGSGVGNGTIYDILLRSDNNYFIVGNFTDYNGNATSTSPINSIAIVSNKGALVTSSIGMGAVGGSIASIQYNSSYYFLGGSFNTYNVRGNINNMTRVFTNGALDTTTQTLVNSDPVSHPENSTDTVPTFNGGFNGSVLKIFNTGSQLIVLGNYSKYYSYYYYRSTSENLVLDQYNIGMVTRLNLDGSIDSTYNQATPTTGNKGGNGYISDAVQLSSGKIILAGSFTSFNGVSLGRIGALADDGNIDATFNSGKTGADGDITSITYNTTTHKILIAGSFKHYNGESANGVALLNEDGSLDAGFQFRVFSGGIPNFAAQMSGGKILVSGSFTQYDNVYRQGLLFLNPDGSLASGYNTLGAFVGRINKMIETTSSLGNPAVIIVGTFKVLNNKTAGGIAKLEVL